ncbi:hypothetical protein BC835DRAFT_1410531 [Cytidiella melzeri]|nr:hypothetical protein BC835DRAFT_1410531 [Cytidiella melzeri]
MPSVHPAYISLDKKSVLSAIDVLDQGSPTTPDADFAVEVVNQNGVGTLTSTTDSDATYQDKARASKTFKPHLCLSNLSLHSPHSFVGTPFDVSPRFEYPFPPTTGRDTGIITPSPARHPTTTTPFAPTSLYVHGTVTLGQSPLALNRPGRSFSPTHPKLATRDAPVPPGLAAKKRPSVSSMIVSMNQQRKRSRSAVSDREHQHTSPKLARAQVPHQARRSFNEVCSSEVEMMREGQRGTVHPLSAEPFTDDSPASSPTMDLQEVSSAEPSVDLQGIHEGL